MPIPGSARLIAVLATVAALVVASTPAHAASKRCGGVFRVTKQDSSATYSVAVRNLRADGATCTRAKHVARVAARAMLDDGIAAVPQRIDGFKMTVPETCATCAPQYALTGRKGRATIRFKLFGGG